MQGLPNFSRREHEIAYELRDAISDARSLRELHDSTHSLMAELCGADHVALCMARPENPLHYEWKSRTMTRLLRDYSEWAQGDFVRNAVMHRPNKALRDAEMLRGANLERTETWQRCREHMKLRHVLSASLVPMGWGSHGGITFYSERRSGFSPRSAVVVDWLVPRMLKAFQSIARISKDDFQTRIREAISRQDSASIVVDSNGGEVLWTPSAPDLLGNWFPLLAALPLRLPDTWRARLKECLTQDGTLRPGTETWREEGKGGILKVSVHALSRVTDHPLWELRMEEDSPRGVRRLREDWRLRLTPAEAKVASLLLLQGGTNEDIARERGRTEGTVKKQLQRIYRKVGADNRTDFMLRGLDDP